MSTEPILPVTSATFSSQMSVQSSSKTSPKRLVRSQNSCSFSSNAEVRLLASSGVRLPTSSDSLSGVRLPTSSDSLATAFTSTGSMQRPFCRICHCGADVAPLITPCRCAGTMQFIHRQCLMKWLEMSRRRSRKSPRCELCKYQYNRHKKFKFHNWRSPRVSRRDKILHVVFLVNLFIMIGCAVATIMCFLSDKRQISSMHRNAEHLSAEEVITLTCGVLFFLSFFVAMGVQIKARHTLYQVLLRFIRQNMEWRIDEYDRQTDSSSSADPSSADTQPTASSRLHTGSTSGQTQDVENTPEFV